MADKQLKSLTLIGLNDRYVFNSNPPATDEIYFDITEEGVISLRQEYRGEAPAAAASQEVYAAAVSDRGADLAGTRNRELPEEIIIPETVGGITVTAYAYAMFLGNKRIKKLTLHSGIKEIPGYFCYNTWNLRSVLGTESVESLAKYAFANSGILAACFPALKEINAGAFSGCCDLVTADIGNTIAEIPQSCFSMCQRLEVVRNASAVTSIGKSGFMDTYRLKTLPFLANLTSVGDYGLTISRVDYDWDSLTECTFGTWATAADYRGEDYWSACAYTACNTPVRSTFHQDDPRWVDKTIGNLERTWDVGCIIVCAAMAYSALEGVDFSSPEEFTALVYAADASLMDVDPGSAIDGIEQYLAAVGYNATRYDEFNTENLQAMYDALAEGAMVIHRCLAGKNNGNHDVLIHGINADGEVLCVDPGALSERIGEYEAITYSMPIQNRTRAAEGTDKDWFWVVRKMEE